MFDFLKRRKKKSESAPAVGRKAPATPQKTIFYSKTVVMASPKGPSLGVAEEPGWRVGKTMQVPGLGNFVIHDIKGGEGKTGMGVVYIVLDNASMTPYAVKTFQQWCLDTPDLVQQFLREAETWIKLEQHQNIVRAYYVAVLDGQPYVFLEYVSGSDLRKKLASGPLPIPSILRYGIQFCRGMMHAQAKMPGMVHRDVKPENCMFTSDDVLKVTDFGLVKVLARSDVSPQSASANDLPDDSRSRTFKTPAGGMGVGTLSYMAPEQFTHFSDVNVRADIYSFGVMLYEMLLGYRPFKANNFGDWYYQHLKVVPTEPSLIDERVNNTLSQVAMRCLAKRPEDRYPDFAMLEKDLAMILWRDHKERLPSVTAQDLEGWEILNKGAALGNLGRTKEALQCFDQVLAISPGMDGAWLNKGVILTKLGRESEALECYQKSLDINPHSPHAWFNSGVASQNLGDLEGALQSYNRALELNPHSDSVWLNKGVVLRKINRPEDALACYDRAVAINPTSAVGWYNKGCALRQLGRSTDELQCYDRAVSINPDYSDAWLNRGTALRKMNRLIEALVCYDRVLALDARHADAWYNKGIVMRKLGQTAESKYAFQRAAALNVDIAAELKRRGLYSG